jgi:hypothetical protein
MVNVLLHKPTLPSFRHTATEITENSIENFVFFVSSCESDVQDLDDHYTIYQFAECLQNVGQAFKMASLFPMPLPHWDAPTEFHSKN